jgi:hypothetical protein
LQDIQDKTAMNCVAIDIVERNLKAAERQAFTINDALFLLEWPVLKFAAAAIPENR